MGFTESARYLSMPRQAFHRWAYGDQRSVLLLHVLGVNPRREAPVPFIALAEAHVLDALRMAHVRLHKIRPALQRPQHEFGTENVLTFRELATDGIDVLSGTSPARRRERD